MNRTLFAALAALAALAVLLPASPSAAAEPTVRPKRITVAAIGYRHTPYKGQSDGEMLNIQKRIFRSCIEEVLPDRPDLVVFPEVYDRFSGMTPEQQARWYEFRGDKLRDYLAELARQHRCYIAYAAHRVMPDGTLRNAMQLIDRDGKVAGIYHKNYPTPDEMTSGKVICGAEAPVFQTDFGRVGMLLCFDLNFLELMQVYAEQQPDLLIFGSMYHGGLMQNFWAYHCQSYLVGAFSPKCSVVDPLGVTVAENGNYRSTLTAAINLDYQIVHLDGNNRKLRELKKKYGKAVVITVPADLGVAMVSSEHPAVSATAMLKEFKIESWREYYRRTLLLRGAPGRTESSPTAAE